MTNHAASAAMSKLYYDRKKWGVCVVCGKPMKNGEETITCAFCLEKRRAQASAKREILRKQSKELRERHMAAGICIFCKSPALENSSRCEFHNEYYSSANQRLRKAKKERERNAESGT